MAINVELRGHGLSTVEGHLSEGLALEPGLLPKLGEPSFPYLSLVDPYSETYFSQQQMRAVLPEIRRLIELCPEEGEMLREIETLAELCSESSHTYLVFLGD